MKDKVIELREYEVICPVCKGARHLEKSIYVCGKCNGDGKVDWVANVVTRNKKRSSLDQINMRRILVHIKSFVDKLQFEPNDKTTVDKLRGLLEEYLFTIHTNKAIYDYKITQTPDNHLTLHIKPSLALEIIQMDLTIV